MVGICHIQLGNSDGPMDRVCLPDFLKDAGGGAHPNCIDSGALSLTVVSFTLDVPSSGCADEFIMSRGRRCFWGTAAIRDNLRLSPNNLRVSAAGKRILNPSCTQWYNSPRMNAGILGVHAKAWGPFVMARSTDLCV